jgi:hypothetical protein
MKNLFMVKITRKINLGKTLILKKEHMQMNFANE